MKKSLLFLPVLVLMQVTLLAQYAEGIKLLNYEKNKSAKEVFQKLVDANPQDPQATYWLGQALLATDGGEPSKDQVAAEIRLLLPRHSTRKDLPPLAVIPGWW